MPLLSLGMFAFEVKTAPFETIKRSTQYRWASKDRVRRAPARQPVGPGADTLTIEGALVPELTGGISTLNKLRDMMASGKVWILTAGTGEVLGKWFITGIEETKSHMLANGSARKIAFSLTLEFYPDDDSSLLGKLLDSRI